METQGQQLCTVVEDAYAPTSVAPERLQGSPAPAGTVQARTLLTRGECAEIERLEKASDRPMFVAFRVREESFEARLDGQVPAGAVAQRSASGLVSRPVIVGG